MSPAKGCDNFMSILLLPVLQNQSTGDELVGGFDSHALPPFIFSIINTSNSLQVSASGRKGQIGSDRVCFASHVCLVTPLRKGIANALQDMRNQQEEAGSART